MHVWYLGLNWIECNQLYELSQVAKDKVTSLDVLIYIHNVKFRPCD